jgi:hypothetical protein
MEALIAHARQTEQLLTHLLAFFQTSCRRCSTGEASLFDTRITVLHAQSKPLASTRCGKLRCVLLVATVFQARCVALKDARSRYKAFWSTRNRRKLCSPVGVVLKLVLTSFDWRAHVAVVLQPP